MIRQFCVWWKRVTFIGSRIRRNAFARIMILTSPTKSSQNGDTVLSPSPVDCFALYIEFWVALGHYLEVGEECARYCTTTLLIPLVLFAEWKIASHQNTVLLCIQTVIRVSEAGIDNVVQHMSHSPQWCAEKVSGLLFLLSLADVVGTVASCQLERRIVYRF